MKLIEYEQINEKVYSEVLPNGLPVFIVPKPGYHKKYVILATDYGGIDRRFQVEGKWIDTPAGVAHFLEHKMFDTVDGDALELLSALGTYPNAYTSTDITAYHFECTERFAESLDVLLNFVSVPYFTPESVEKEKGIITQEIRMTDDDPDYCLYYEILKSLFKSNPLRDSVAGTIESIQKITAETLYDCHKYFYAPSNMALCVVGDVDPKKVIEMAQRISPESPYSAPQRDYGPPETYLPITTSTAKTMEVSLPIFLAGCKVKPAENGKERLKQDIISAMALEMLFGHSSPLYLRLYSEGQINTDFSASFDSAAGVAYTIFGGEARYPQRVFQEVMDEINRAGSQGLDQELFRRIKKAAIGGHIRALNSFGVIAGGIVEGHFRGFDVFEAPSLLSKISIEDIQEYIRKNLVPDNMAISVINPKNEVIH